MLMPPVEAQKAACRVAGPLLRLPEVPEASGIAVSRRTPGVLWTHNDSGQPWLFAFTTAGAPAGRVRVSGAQVVDWEDIAVGPCGSGSCVYIGDIGDNDAKRQTVTIYRVPEPAPRDPATAPADALQAVYPDRPHDAEALFVLPDGGLFIVTKEDPVALYRVPGPFRAGTTVRLERVATLAPQGGTSRSAGRRAHVTGADASPDGRWVALRTNAAVMFYSAREFVAGQIREVLHYDVTALHEPQGEGVAFGAANDIWLAGEGGGTFGTLARVECTLK